MSRNEKPEYKPPMNPGEYCERCNFGEGVPWRDRNKVIKKRAGTNLFLCNRCWKIWKENYPEEEEE